MSSIRRAWLPAVVAAGTAVSPPAHAYNEFLQRLTGAVTAAGDAATGAVDAAAKATSDGAKM